jgi:CRP-like cAMP-binding protein
MDERTRRQTGDLLRQGRWFGRLPDEVQDTILRHAVIREFAKGQVIQIEDSPTGSGLGAVLEGSVQLLRHTNEDEEPSLIHVGWAGFWFGELVCLDAGITAVTVVARTKARILFLAKSEFDRMASEDARLYRALTQLVCLRYRLVLRFLAEAREAPPDAHLRLRLADLAEMRRLDGGSTDGPVELAMSQAELGRIVGLSRQKVNARLQGLQVAGWIRLRQAAIQVADPGALRASATSRRAHGPLARARGA